MILLSYMKILYTVKALSWNYLPRIPSYVCFQVTVGDKTFLQVLEGTDVAIMKPLFIVWSWCRAGAFAAHTHDPKESSCPCCVATAGTSPVALGWLLQHLQILARGTCSSMGERHQFILQLIRIIVICGGERQTSLPVCSCQFQFVPIPSHSIHLPFPISTVTTFHSTPDALQQPYID